MNKRDLPDNLVAVAVFAAIACLMWWLYFYLGVLEAVGTRSGVGQFVTCVLVDSALCSAAKTAASFAGRFVYEPMFMGISLVTMATGFILRFKESNSPS